MKLCKKLIVLCIAIILLMGCFACGEGDDDDEVILDSSKSQLYISNYNGGFGTQWLYKVRDRFESTYSDYSFEEGKKGVQLIISADKDGYFSDTLFNSFKGNRNEVFFSEGISYYDFLNNDYFLDITDIFEDTTVYNTLDVNNDSKKIKDKMTKDQVDFLTNDGKIYAVPHYLGLDGIVYDIDLFDSNELYIASEGGYTNLAGEKSDGPDGKKGTYDDGLPATYQEFYDLCEYMTNNTSIKPFTMSGKLNGTYGNNFIGALAVDGEGENASKMFDFTGDEKLVSLSTFDVEEDATDINNENGYEIYRQSGLYYAFSFIENIRNYFDENSVAEADTHTDAQTRFLRSTTKSTQFAFLVEGNWWENESSSVFDSMAKTDAKYSKSNRRFGFLPFPKPTEEMVGTGTSVIDNNLSFAFINSSIEKSKINMAKTFLKFCYTDYSLVEYTQTTGAPKAMKYTIDDMSKLPSEFSRQVWNLYSAEETRLINPYSRNSLFLKNQSKFIFKNMYQVSDGTSAFTALLKGTKTASKVLTEIYNKQKNSWNTLNK